MPKINPNTLELEERVVRVTPVSKTHKGGRRRRFSAMVVVGDGKGHVGAGLGKASGVPDAIRKATEAAKKNLILVPLMGTTIPHRVEVGLGASHVLLRPASDGTGVIAGGAVRAVVEAAGIKNILTKSLGSSNAVGTVWATMECLRHLKRAAHVARLRGKRLEELPISARLRKASEEYEHETAGHVEAEPHRLSARPEGDRSSLGVEEDAPNGSLPEDEGASRNGAES